MRRLIVLLTAFATTLALFGSRLYAVNARFGLPPGPYNVIQVSRN